MSGSPESIVEEPKAAKEEWQKIPGALVQRVVQIGGNVFSAFAAEKDTGIYIGDIPVELRETKPTSVTD